MILQQTIRQTFSASDVSQMTGARPDSIQNWIKRELIVGHKGLSGKGQGRHRKFTFENVMDIALARTMVQMNVGAKEAFEASSQFAYAGGGGVTFELPSRLPGLPFHHSHGETVLGVAGDRTFETTWNPAKSHDTYTNLRENLQSDHFLTVDASAVFRRVCSRFPHHPFAILDAVYPEDAT